MPTALNTPEPPIWARKRHDEPMIVSITSRLENLFTRGATEVADAQVTEAPEADFDFAGRSYWV